MKRFIKFTVKRHLESQPFYHILPMDTEKAMDFILFKNATWIEGEYYPEYQVLTDVEALIYVKTFIESEREANLEDSDEYINNLLSQLRECYGIDYKPNN